MEDEVEWIRPKAVQELILAYRKEWRAHLESYLRPALYEGLITAKAKRVRVLRTRESREEVADDWRVDPKVWKPDSNSSAFDLTSDSFTTRAIGTGFRSVKLTGLSFNKAELLEFAEIDPGALGAVSREGGADVSDTEVWVGDENDGSGPALKNKGGAPTDATKWCNLVAVVGAIFANQDLVDGDTPLRRSQVRKIIEDYADKVGLPIGSKGTIDPAIDLLIKIAWRDHHEGEPLFAADGRPLNSDSNLGN